MAPTTPAAVRMGRVQARGSAFGTEPNPPSNFWNLEVQNSPAEAGGSRRPNRRDNKGKEKVDNDTSGLSKAAVEGLALLRDGFYGVVEAERTKLQESRHNAYKTVATTAARLREGKDRLKFIQSRVDVGTACLNKFIQQSQTAEGILNTTSKPSVENPAQEYPRPH